MPWNVIVSSKKRSDVFKSANDYSPIIPNISKLINGGRTPHNTNTNNTNTKNSNNNILYNNRKIERSSNNGITETRSDSFLDYIDRLEQKFNSVPNMDEDASPMRMGLTSNQVEELEMANPSKQVRQHNLQALVEASNNPKTFISALNKSIEYLQVWRETPNPISTVYANAKKLIKAQAGVLSEKQIRYAKDQMKHLHNSIIACGGSETLSECNPTASTTDEDEERKQQRMMSYLLSALPEKYR